MALECSRENLRALDAEAHAIVFDCGKRGLRDTRAPYKLNLAEPLQLADDAYRLAHRYADRLLRLPEFTRHGLRQALLDRSGDDASTLAISSP